MILTFVAGFAAGVPPGPDECFASLSAFIAMEWSGYSSSSVNLLPAAYRNDCHKGKQKWRQVSRGKSREAIMRKHYGHLAFHTEIEASTAFRLLTRLQSVPIVAALQSVGEFSRAFSKAPTRNCFAKSILILKDGWGKACVARRR